MPIYFFNLFNDAEWRDDEGAECPDLAAAKDIAIASARELMAEHVTKGRPVHLHHRIEVADADGKVLATIPFNEVITVTE